MTLPEILKEIDNRGLTAYEIAKETNLTEAGVMKIINGSSQKPRKSTLQTLTDYLCKDDDSKVKEEPETYKQEKPSTEELLRVINNKLDMYFQQSQDQRAAIAEASKITVENTDKLLLDTMEINRTINDTSQKFERLFRLLDDRRKF